MEVTNFNTNQLRIEEMLSRAFGMIEMRNLEHGTKALVHIARAVERHAGEDMRDLAANIAAGLASELELPNDRFKDVETAFYNAFSMDIDTALQTNQPA